MKTTDTAFKTAVHAETFDDIIFDGRNHKYGAYFLRKTYTNNLSLSMLAMLCASALISLLLFQYSRHRPPVEIPVLPPPTGTYTFSGSIPVVPPPSVPELPKEASATSTGGPPVVVDEVTDPAQPATQEELADIPSGNTSESAGPLVAVDQKTDGAVDEKEAYNKFEVNEQAMFQGGSEENFRAWLMKKIRYPEEAEINGIKGTVFVKFAIGRDGKICDVVVEKGIHPLIDGAVVKTLLSSPEWKPAKRNGKAVKVFYYMPVMFDLRQ
jgi:periplasmic protein TonB